jgi:hypothetical protein
MKAIIIILFTQITTLNTTLSQNKSYELIYRTWFANELTEKDDQIGEIISFDTMKLNKSDRNYYLKWEFQKTGKLISTELKTVHDFGESKGASILETSYENIKFEINSSTNEIIIDLGNIVGYGPHKDIYKIIKLNNSKLILKKLTKIQCKPKK